MVGVRSFGSAFSGIALAAAVVMTLAGCGGEPATTDDPAASAPGTTAVTTPAGSAEPAEPSEQPATVAEELNFTATTLDGEPFSGASLAGKPAVLWFWAPWCPNCRAEAPSVAKAADANSVTFVGVAAQDGPDAMRDFVDQYGVGNFQHLEDENADIWRRFGITYQPAYAFVSADGTVDVVKDRLSEEDLNSRVEQLGS
ncbi:Thiol-disulfide isomerase or thioredoxin [Amycolatopsis marina]|uniref:Thiol-disulfide isomerase or thioredoxin n=1 Tax=Amycolatopsis marina TaxID=490629 RepID=A0A1I1BG66_9PSEU|nr:protein disulfide oxidoreductase [Amycolatopsis marina]SFB47490.1 Thiol-disulfide isomerase or thioredoxin [Amycolatopsis marina]